MPDRNIINDLDLQNAYKAKNAVDGTAPQDYVTKAQLDMVVSGLEWKQAVDLATDAALPSNTYSNGASGVGATLTGVAFGALAVDGTTVTVGQRILVKNEVSDSHNGIYVVTTVGAIATLYVLTRSADYDQTSEIQAGTATFVTTGSSNIDTAWVMTATGTITVGTDSITFAQFGGGGGSPTGAAGGSLSGTYPNPGIAAGAVGPTELASTAVTPTTYGDATHVGQFTVDADGRLTAASSVPITPAAAAAGTSQLVYRYTVTGSDKTSIDTGVDTPDAGSNDWTNGDLLEVYFVGRSDQAGAQVVNMTLNNDGSAKYTYADMAMTSGGFLTAAATGQTAARIGAIPGTGAPAGAVGSCSLDFPDFAGVWLKNWHGTGGRIDALSAGNYLSESPFGNWNSTAAITRLAVAPAAGKFKVGTQLLIYKRTAS